MINIGIYIYDRAEVLDFSGPFEVFSTATRMCENDTPFNVFLVAQQLQPVVARCILGSHRRRSWKPATKRRVSTG